MNGSYIQQSLLLPPGTTISALLTFSARNRPSYPAATLSVYFGSALVWRQIPSSSWTSYQVVVTGSSTATLKFQTMYTSQTADVTIHVDNINMGKESILLLYVVAAMLTWPFLQLARTSVVRLARTMMDPLVRQFLQV